MRGIRQGGLPLKIASNRIAQHGFEFIKGVGLGEDTVAKRAGIKAAVRGIRNHEHNCRFPHESLNEL